MNRNLEAIAIVAARECVRQDVDLHALGNLLRAYEYALRHEHEAVTEGHVLELAAIIEPHVNHDGYRRTPVSFANLLSTATAPGSIPSAMETLGLLINGVDPYDAAKALLDIHPFRDGNGRVAWVVFNWLAHNLDDPLALPDFYREAV